MNFECQTKYHYLKYNNLRFNANLNFGIEKLTCKIENEIKDIFPTSYENDVISIWENKCLRKVAWNSLIVIILQNHIV